MQSLNSPFSLPDILKKITRNALLTLDASNVTLYGYHADNNSFYLLPVMDGQFLDPASMDANLTHDFMLFQLKQYGASQYIVDVHQHKVLAAPSESAGPRFIDREKVKSCAVLVLRAGEAGEIVGLMFVNFRETHDFSAEEKRAMDALTTSAALAIRTARLHKVDLTRQLQAMHEVHAAIAEKGPDLKQVLGRLLQQTLALTGASNGVCMQYQEHNGTLEAIARWPVPEGCPIEPQTIGQGIIGLAAKSGKSILVEDVEDDRKSMFVETVGEIFPAQSYKKVNPDTRCEIAVPLLDQGRLLGVLNIEHRLPGALTQDHRALLEALAVPAIIAFHTVELYKQLGRRVKHLSALNTIAARMQQKPYDLDAIIRLFLTGVTAEAGLAFSRAMLFLADEGGAHYAVSQLWGQLPAKRLKEHGGNWNTRTQS
jgi:GAF domain-containing protein